ncbi:GreA/GreB family elongation factor [Cereibacter sphaeroides f. sp. denitrificans]|nr:transcription elongation factor [Cereibacter sphaeroides f. sp. denitrificans]
MSRAFVKEDGPDNTPLPDLPISPHPNLVTPRGLADLQARLLATQARLRALRAREDRLDRLPEAAAERDIRYLEARIASAILVDPAAQPLDEVGRRTVWEITGEDEAQATARRIAPQAPLARALMGARLGEKVVWTRPAGEVTLTVTGIAHPE